MPMYNWVCDCCGASVDILRPFEECGDPPKGEDLKDVKTECAHLWRKVIKAPGIAKGSSWGPGKGSW